ncbi:Transcription factor [Nymphaea thermarum]|nr:Transcription factor [Nymphaea thermarum]
MPLRKLSKANGKFSKRVFSNVHPNVSSPNVNNSTHVAVCWLLRRLVDQFGLRKWSHIVQMLKGRVGKQCRERWHNHLRPNIKKDTWTEEEERLLIAAHSEIGKKWAEIAKRLSGRTENSIKNHWNATKRRQLSKKRAKSLDSENQKPCSILQEYIKSLSSSSAPAPSGTNGQRLLRGFQEEQRTPLRTTGTPPREDSSQRDEPNLWTPITLLHLAGVHQELEFLFSSGTVNNG